jgi:tripartite-type tricarboxylate transporter receptor subunit TctC
MNARGFIIVFVSVLLNPGFVWPSYAQSRFYEGKTITIIQGRGAGGTGDLRVRAAMPFLKKYIPGQPLIINQYMDGGGGRKAANYIYKSVKPDGLTIGNVGGGLALNALLGASGVEYDLDKFIFLGSTNSRQHYVFFTHKRMGLDSLEKLRQATGVRIGARSVGGELYVKGRLFAHLLGMKEPKFVLGYSAAELYTGMESGEIDARAVTADPLLRDRPDWIKQALLHFHAIFEIPKGFRHREFGQLPELASFAVSDTERKLLAMDRAIRLFGTAYLFSPGTPEEPAKILKDAFRKTFNDPQFAKEFSKLTGEDPEPLTADEMDDVLKDLPRDPQVVSLYKTFAGAGPLPARTTGAR